ncbi:MAG: hypothetical protein ABSE89_10870 [Sedimentisphaerales bacterium]
MKNPKSQTNSNNQNSKLDSRFRGNDTPPRVAAAKYFFNIPLSPILFIEQFRQFFVYSQAAPVFAAQ